jgi:hypothetical protein
MKGLEIKSQCTSHNSQLSQAPDGAAAQLPFLLFTYELPSDGLPHLPDWLNTAGDIFQGGYESHREPFEVRLRKLPEGEDPPMARISVVKGTGRSSMLWFGILYTYLRMRDTITEEEMADFRRWGWDTLHRPFRAKTMGRVGVMVPMGPSSLGSLVATILSANVVKKQL